MFDKKERDALKLIFAEYNNRLCSVLPLDSELEDITFTDKFVKKMQRLLYHQKKFYYSFVNTLSKRVACLIAIVVLLFATTTFSVKAFREPFIDLLVETYEKFTRILFPTNSKPDTNIEPTIFENKAPQYVPKGFEAIEKIEDYMQTIYVYEDGNGNTLSFQQTTKGASVTVNTEDGNSKKIFVKDTYEALLFESKGDRGIVFNVNDYVFVITLSKAYPESELIKVAESINI